MGLDMYLYAKPKGAGPDRYKDEEVIAQMTPGDFDNYSAYHEAIKANGLVELGYWRKQNAIHQWFVVRVQGGVDECDPFLCHPEMLADLHERCTAIFNEPGRAEELLPTQSGVFFGGTDYDEWYHEGIADTINILEKTFAEARGVDVYYQASW